MKAHALCLGLVVCLCSACAAPSLRYKSEVNNLIRTGQFEQAESLIASKKNKLYTQKDSVLFYLDRATLLHDDQQPRKSDELFNQAQERIDELYAKSVSASVARLFINDLTTPYYAADYERALTFFYRALNFMQLGNPMESAVEARKAVAFLDELRGTKTKGYTDDPFVQYVSSLIFESVGERSDARISRENAFKAYEKLGLRAPDFPMPADANEKGEVIIFHYNGLLPLKKSQTLQVSWDKLVSAASSPVESQNHVAPEVENAIRAGILGNAVTLAFPVLEKQLYTIAGSVAEVNGQQTPLQKAADLSLMATQDLEEKLPGIWFRLATRAVIRQTAVVQARHAVAKGADNKGLGELAGHLMSALGASLEKADTRQWFTLPAEIYMTRLFLPVGKQDITLLFKDGYGNILKTYTFEDVAIKKGGRVFLHYRTAL